jgi:glycerol kinase
MRETTALGAAIAAGFAVKVWNNFDDLKSINSEGRFFFKPKISQKASDRMYGKWTKAVEMSKGWVDDDEEEHETQREEEGRGLEQTVTKE